jgi:thymidylate synthase
MKTGNVTETRNGQTISLFAPTTLEYSLQDQFPLFTTKRVFFRAIVEELLWFIRGQTNAKILADKGIHIWDGNSSREYLDSIGLKNNAEGDCGPIYGYQWRKFGADYFANNNVNNANNNNTGIDQLAYCINLLKTNPQSRRIFMSAWNPKDLAKMALPPCHISYQWYVEKSQSQLQPQPQQLLSCQVYMRSNDIFLGHPFNVASAALLTIMMAKHCNLTPHRLVICIGDAHIYAEHYQQCEEQLKREPRQFPKLNIKTPKDKLEDYTFEDFELIDYNPHPKIDAKML